MNGILIINKPKGFTSHDVVGKVRRILHTKKVGHAGTLDPLATGVLVVLVGKATKLSERLLCEKKQYRAEFCLGLTTDTYDITGNVVSKTEVDVSEEKIAATLDKFKGKISQVPPMYSAIKLEGKKLYELARKGVTVERKPREIEIYSLTLNGKNTLDIECSKGTYIRSLVHDFGQELSCGACLTELERRCSGSFSVENSVTLEELEEKGFDACALTIDEVINATKINVSGEFERRIKNGNEIVLKGITGECKVFGADGTLLCIAAGDGIKIRPSIMLFEGEL